MNFRAWVSWRFLLICGSSSLFFFSIGVVFTQAILSQTVNEYAVSIAKKNDRIAILEFFVKSQATAKANAFASLMTPAELTPLQAPVEVAVPKVAETPKQLAASPVPPALMTKPKAEVKPESKVQKQVIEPKPVQAQVAAVAPPVVAPTQTPETKKAAGTSERDVRYIVGEELFKATASGNVEGVSAEKAGISKLTTDAVVMRSGLSVRVGQMFPSGERLLLVDRENGRIVTNSRQLLIFNLSE